MSSLQSVPGRELPSPPDKPPLSAFDLPALVALLRQMAHDMRAPLGAVVGTSDLLCNGGYGELTPQQARANDRIRRSSARMVALLDDFMLYIKAQANQITLNPAPFDPRELLSMLREQIATQAAAKALALNLEMTDDLPLLLVGDVTQIRYIVLALLTNAVAYTESGGVWLESGWEESQWVITVRDSGPGIAPDNQIKVFEPFFRGDQRPQMASSGFGLGLSVAAALVSHLGGQIALQKSDATGSTFVVRLPFAVPPVSAGKP